MELNVLRFEQIGDVAVVRMNNPPANALNVNFLEDFERIIHHLEGHRPARAMMLASDCPGFFSAGDDIESLQTVDDNTFALLPRAHALLNRIEDLSLPTVAAINGHALGGGLELALVCDFRFMGKDAGRIGLPEVRLGMIPALGGTQRLPRIVGRAKAIEMMFKGLQVTADEARVLGLVNDVFPQEEIEAKSLDFAQRLARQATGAIACIKASVNAGMRYGFEKGLAVEMAMFEKNIVSRDAGEGVAAFLQGRKPEFSGGST